MVVCATCKEEMELLVTSHQLLMEDGNVGEGDLYLCAGCEIEVVTNFKVLPNVYYSNVAQRFVRKGEI